MRLARAKRCVTAMNRSSEKCLFALMAINVRARRANSAWLQNAKYTVRKRMPLGNNNARVNTSHAKNDALANTRPATSAARHVTPSATPSMAKWSST